MANPTSKVRDRANQAISHHVAMQLADRLAETNARLDRVDEAIEALRATLANLQSVTTELSVECADRISAIEALVSTPPSEP